MIDLREYGKGAVFTLPLIDITGSQDFEVGMTFAAGDAKMGSNKQGSSNLTCEFAAFTGGDTEPNSGDSIVGVDSSSTAIVIGVVLTGGSWGGGDAAGTIFVASVSGAWQAEVVNNTTQSDADSMDLVADFTPSIGIKIIGQYVAFGLTIAEMQCKFADVFIQDQGSDVWIDDMYKIQTYGNASAMHGFNLATATQDVNAVAISGDTATAGNLRVLFDGVEGFASAYMGPRGPGIYLNDAVGNVNTVNGTDGTWANPVSTIAAAKTIADSLSVDRIYLVNDSVITLGATMENYEFIGMGDIASNTIDLNSQDVDFSYFENVLISGAQGGSGRFMAHRCALSTLTGLETMAWECAIVNNLTVRQDSFFDKCWSAVAGNGTPTLDINSVADVNITWRNGAGGLQIDNAVSTTTVSYESDGQIIVDGSCTSLTLTVRGNCTITDNGTTTSLTQDAAVNRTNINAEVDTALVDIKLDHLIAVADNDAPVDNSIIAHLASKTEDWSTFAPSDDSLEAIRDHATTIKSETAAIVTTLNGLVPLKGTIGSTGNDTTHVHIDAGLAYGDDDLNGSFLVIFDDSTGEFHTREITDYDGAGDLATVALLPFTPEDATDLFWILSAQVGAGGTPPTVGQIRTELETNGSKLDHLWEMTEDDSGTRRLTTNALEQGPDSDTTTGLSLHGDYDAAKTAAPAGEYDTEMARITAVRMAVLTDWINGGRLDLLLDAIPTTAMRGTDGANTSKTGYALASNGLDSVSVEAGVNARQALAIIASALAGVLSGAATTTITIKALKNDGTTRISATVDADGNRSAITATLPA